MLRSTSGPRLVRCGDRPEHGRGCGKTYMECRCTSIYAVKFRQVLRTLTDAIAGGGPIRL